MREREPFKSLSPDERMERTLRAKEAGLPLLDRWRQLDGYASEPWEWRARLAASWLYGAASVADLGCGAMALERYLRPAQTYIPVDLVVRDERTIVTDFNREPLGELSASHFAALGLLEYLYDLPGFLRQLACRFEGGVLSFLVGDGAAEDARLARGLVNHQTTEALLALLADGGLDVVRVARVRGRTHMVAVAARSRHGETPSHAAEPK